MRRREAHTKEKTRPVRGANFFLCFPSLLFVSLIKDKGHYKQPSRVFFFFLLRDTNKGYELVFICFPFLLRVLFQGIQGKGHYMCPFCAQYTTSNPHGSSCFFLSLKRKGKGYALVSLLYTSMHALLFLACFLNLLFFWLTFCLEMVTKKIKVIKKIP